MRTSQAKELFRRLTAKYFSGAEVVFANQSRQPKGSVPLVVITCGNVGRHQFVNYENINGVIVGNYLSRFSVTVDLFTKGTPVIDGGKIIGYEDTAIDDILAFADFVGSEYTIWWSQTNDITVLIDGDAQSLTGVVNDTSYEYRSRLSFFVYFTQRTIDSAAAASERSILYPVNGEYTPERPIIKTSTTGNYGSPEETAIKNAVVEKTFTPTSSGGGSQELADDTTGYFTDAEIKEEKY